MGKPLGESFLTTHELLSKNSFVACGKNFAKICWQYRLTGLAAGAAFYALLALPPLFFGLLGTVGFIADSFSTETVDSFRTSLIELATPFLTEEAINNLLIPTVDEVLAKGRIEILSIGFFLALWSGSKAVTAIVETCTIVYGVHRKRGFLVSRIISVGVYLLFLATMSILLPLVLAGPVWVKMILPNQFDVIALLYWPAVILATTVILTTLFYWTVPKKQRWSAHFPGVVLTLATWLLGSWLLREFLGRTLNGASLYGPLAAPIGLLLWLYLVNFAILLGAALNAAVSLTWPRFIRRGRLID